MFTLWNIILFYCIFSYWVCGLCVLFNWRRFWKKYELRVMLGIILSPVVFTVYTVWNLVILISNLVILIRWKWKLK